jgi:hypothetical protein
LQECIQFFGEQEFRKHKVALFAEASVRSIRCQYADTALSASSALKGGLQRLERVINGPERSRS